MNEYVEEYREYTIRRSGDGLTIYDKDGCYVKRVETLIIHKAENEIDEIISKEESCDWNE